MDKLEEIASVILQFEKEMKKLYNENNKLQKQSKPMNRPSLFLNHCILKKEYIVSYVRAYDGAAHEVYLTEMANLLNPNIFKRGALIISCYDKTKITFTDDSTHSFRFSDNVEDTTFVLTNVINMPIISSEFMNCGTTFSATDILMGGKKEFHDNLGWLKKVYISMKDLEPVTITKARQLCSIYIQCIKQCENTAELPILIIPSKSEKHLIQAGMIFYSDFSENHELLHIGEVQDSVSLLKSSHGCGEEISYLASYDILGELTFDSYENSVKEETSLKVDFHWCGGDYQVFEQPPHSAKAVLHLQVTVGEARSAANDIFQELTALDSIFNNTQTNSASLLSSSSAEKINQNLVAFKESVSDFSYYGNKEDLKQTVEQTDDLEKPVSQLIQQSFRRNDQDFTDKLWTFLRQDEVIENLRSYLDEILGDIVDGSLQPAVSPTNETKLAKFIRRMYLANIEESKLHIKEKILEFLSSDQSVQALVSEIGYEKLRKDYYNFFLSKELASINDLQKLLNPNSPLDISVLWKLHYCFEIVVTPAMYLNLAQDCQSTLLKAAIEYYSTASVQASSPVFSLSLLPFHDSTSLVRQACETRQPFAWQRGALSVNKAGFKETSVLFVKTKNTITDDDDVHVEGTIQEDTLLLSEGVVCLPIKKI